MKYVLIEVVDRDISKPEFFDSFEAAHYRMCELVAKAADVSIDDISDENKLYGMLGIDAHISRYHAWCDDVAQRDWSIFDVDEDEILCKPQMGTEGDDKK